MHNKILSLTTRWRSLAGAIWGNLFRQSTGTNFEIDVLAGAHCAGFVAA
jgi:hypothetical protein